MAPTSTVIAGIYGLVAVSWVLIGFAVWQHRDRMGVRPLLGIVLGAWWWSAALFLASNVDSYVVSMWLQRSTYVGTVVLITSVFLFTLEYTGRQHLLTWKTLALVSIQPIFQVYLTFWNPANTFFTTIEPAPSTVTGVFLEFGVLYWLNALYIYILLAISLFLLFQSMHESGGSYRLQFALVAVSIFAPTVANYAYIGGIVTFDATPIGLLLAAVLVWLAITRYRLIDIVPIARDQVLDSITDAVYMVDVEGRIVDANPAGRALLRRETTGDELVGWDIEAFFDAIPEAEGVYEELTETRAETRIETTRDGTWFDVTATPIEDPRDEHVGWLFIVRDVTERKRREEEIRRRNEQLDKFASVVSHDLRNPLSVAKGYVQLASETDDLSHLEKVEMAHERMAAIIEDVLTLAREGEAVTETEPLSIGAIADRAWRNVATGASELNVESDGAIVADEDRLVRIFENLFRNAVEHGTSGHRSSSSEASMTRGASAESTDGDAHGAPEVGVEVGLTDSGFYVADDGVGIPETDRETVFESGYTTAEEGVGSGLDIVRQLAEAHGWTVSATESAAGGARFEFDGVSLANE